jgi:hypothetical protein
VARLKSCPSQHLDLVAPQSAGDCAEHKVPPLRFAPVGVTELFCNVGTAEFFRSTCGCFRSLVSHPFAKNAKEWGTLRFGLGGKERGAEILRWESPALPETPLPQDDGGGMAVRG